MIDAFGQDLELLFPPAEDRVLSLTARVEGERISETPFQFPSENLYKPMSGKSHFYPYKPVGVKLEEDSPFFKEYSLTGTGHPSGYTYGWVWNDDHHLYVKIDFTPDNTMDGDKDYAKVYVKAEGKIREFKVSELETRWGHPEFAYTDKVSYEHKVYGFKIPLRELGVSVERTGQELLLAFSAYGTAGPPAVSFSPSQNSYVVPFEKYGGGPPQIRGQVVDQYGFPVGSDFPIADAGNASYNPSIAYDSVNGRYLVVWSDSRNGIGNSDIYGQFVNPNGTLSGTNFIVCNVPANQLGPSVAYDSVNQRFLVTWTDNRNEATTFFDIYGQLLNANGTPNGAEIIVSNATNNQTNSSVAYDSANQRFLVTWTDQRDDGTTGHDIYGQLLNANGTPNGGNFPICNANSNQDGGRVAYDSANQRFLVVWTETRNMGTTSGDIYGQLLNANGTPNGGEIIISNANDQQYVANVAYDSAYHRFLVVWVDQRNNATTSADIYGQFVDASGSLGGGNFVINDSPGYQYAPCLAYNSNCLNFLVAYWLSSSALGYTVVGPPCAGAAVAAAPTLSEWGIIILVGMVGTGSFYYLRKRRAGA